MPEPQNGAGKDRQFVTALARGLEILRCFQAGDRSIDVNRGLRGVGQVVLHDAQQVQTA